MSDPKRPGLKKATLDKQLRAFKANFRNVICKITDHKGTGNLFMPAKQSNNILAGVAIIGKQPALACNIYVTEKDKKPWQPSTEQ